MPRCFSNEMDLAGIAFWSIHSNLEEVVLYLFCIWNRRKYIPFSIISKIFSPSKISFEKREYYARWINQSCLIFFTFYLKLLMEDISLLEFLFIESIVNFKPWIEGLFGSILQDSSSVGYFLDPLSGSPPFLIEN